MQHFTKMYILVLNRLQLPQTCLAGMVIGESCIYHSSVTYMILLGYKHITIPSFSLGKLEKERNHPYERETAYSLSYDLYATIISVFSICCSANFLTCKQVPNIFSVEDSNLCSTRCSFRSSFLALLWFYQGILILSLFECHLDSMFCWSPTSISCIVPVEICLTDSTAYELFPSLSSHHLERLFVKH